MRYPKFTKEYKSLMSQYLTNDIFEKLKARKTEYGYTLKGVINSGLENPDSGIGVYAGDAQSYILFRDLFDPIIENYHGFTPTEQHQCDLNVDNLNIQNPDPDNEYIISTRIRVGRNLAGIPLGPAISKEQRKQVEQKVSASLDSLAGELAGRYYPLEGMIQADQDALIKDHFLFKAGDRFLESAGLNRDWPSGRGIYHNDEKTFLVWINEEDQLRIISMQSGGDIKQVFQRLVLAIKELEKQLRFSFDPHLGYITSCPTNLGTAMRASVHIRLPKLAQHEALLNSITEQHHLQIRGIHGEHSHSEGGIYDISNKRRLGITEVQCVCDLYEGVLALIQAEQRL